LTHETPELFVQLCTLNWKRRRPRFNSDPPHDLVAFRTFRTFPGLRTHDLNLEGVAICPFHQGGVSSPPLQGWEEVERLSVLNLMYDTTPARCVTPTPDTLNHALYILSQYDATHVPHSLKAQTL
jgi:hypothetical protein